MKEFLEGDEQLSFPLFSMFERKYSDACPDGVFLFFLFLQVGHSRMHSAKPRLCTEGNYHLSR